MKNIQTNIPKPISFPLIPEKKMDIFFNIGVNLWVFAINAILFVVFLYIHFTSDVNLLGLIVFNIFIFAFYRIFSICKEESSGCIDGVCLRSKNRIRLDLEGIRVVKDSIEKEYSLKSIENLQLNYNGLPKEFYKNFIGSFLGVGNSISFIHNGENVNIRFYIDNSTWVKLLDKMLFYWAWYGTHCTIIHKGREIIKLPIDDKFDF